MRGAIYRKLEECQFLAMAGARCRNWNSVNFGGCESARPCHADIHIGIYGEYISCCDIDNLQTSSKALLYVKYSIICI